jgi:DNA-directed RNA polymerase sigma subunit (sigma70/sigma32)
VIPRAEAAHWLKQAIERNINGNADHVKVAKIFENLLSAIEPRGKPKPDHPTRKKSK